MAQAAPSHSQEYWRPADPNVARAFESAPGKTACRRCGAEYLPGARFCHICGASREPELRPHAVRFNPRNAASWLLPLRLALPIPSFICFILGVACILGAVLMSVIYQTDSLVDWQAVQIWRIQWLLASLVALLAGLLLKNASR